MPSGNDTESKAGDVTTSALAVGNSNNNVTPSSASSAPTPTPTPSPFPPSLIINALQSSSSAAATSSANAPILSFTDARSDALEEESYGKFSWKINWELNKAAAVDMLLVQKVEVDYEVHREDYFTRKIIKINDISKFTANRFLLFSADDPGFPGEAEIGASVAHNMVAYWYNCSPHRGAKTKVEARTMCEPAVLWQKIRIERNKPPRVVPPRKVSAPAFVQSAAPVTGPSTNLLLSSAASSPPSSSSSSSDSPSSSNKVQKTGLNSVKKVLPLGSPPMVYDPSKSVGNKRKALTPPNG